MGAGLDWPRFCFASLFSPDGDSTSRTCSRHSTVQSEPASGMEEGHGPGVIFLESLERSNVSGQH